ALCDRPHVDSRFPKRAEELPRHPDSLDHSIADHRDDAATFSQIDRLHLAALYFSVERLLNSLARELRLRTRNREADRMFRTRLRDHDDRHIDRAQRAEEFMGH